MHEHYSLDMMESYGMSVPRGEVAMTPEEAKQIADKFGTLLWTLIHKSILFRCV